MNNKELDNTAQPFVVHKSIDLIDLVREAVVFSPDKIVRSMGRGWFPRLIRQALTLYIAHLKSMKGIES